MNDDIVIDEHARNRLADAMDQLKAQMATLAESQREWAALTATGTAANSRVTVVVNANGVITETTFANDIGDLDYPEIAAAVTQAHQQAVTEIHRKTAELMGPVQAQAMAGVGLEDLVPAMPNPLDPLSALTTPAAQSGDGGVDDPGGRGVLRRSW
ncbi:YbaB/EbfC family nucleoid-associated protein [Nocardia sp. NEAU-G5]|uniref:YbaB/EbfC family nucleoid-associated protein n=1 Tax=Nocardia albiluteola TaxID=2842303 RepID=A0ABS6AY43_9NOCA|nr:YbaB/EbfC family nucleoid-associated protein [Nocardia albiluteola]MBU3062973.1 YbaB/EbfC family nucleoid-associated protein [Nocardia albiluteola]